jgi:hypothetical protein
VRAKFLIGLAAVLTVLAYLSFIPNRFFTKHFETNYKATRLYCGATDVEVSTAVGGASMIVNYNEYRGDNIAETKSIELFYFGSAMFSDHYRAKTGETAEYDGELKLENFGGGVGGTCL